MKVNFKEMSQQAVVLEYSHCSGESTTMRVREASGSSLRVLIFAEHAHKKQQRTYNDGAVGNIERRPVMHADVEIQKVRDFAINHSVPEIAYRPAQNQRECQSAGMKDS